MRKRQTHLGKVEGPAEAVLLERDGVELRERRKRGGQRAGELVEPKIDGSQRHKVAKRLGQRAPAAHTARRAQEGLHCLRAER